MIGYAIRSIKRLLVLAPGLAIAYVGIKDVYPLINRRLAAAPAFLLTYILIAYVGIPALIRLIRIVVRPRHIPLYCVTPDGFASDPVNIGLIGSREQVISAMTKAGWYLADNRTPKTLFRMVLSILLKQNYPNAPFSSLFLFGRRQDLGFELLVDGNPNHRHHVRFWLSEPTLSKQEKQHLEFWQGHSPTKSKRKGTPQLWVGAASLDTGLSFIRHNAQLTHMIHPDTNAERDLIVRHLHKTGLVKTNKSVEIGTPYQLRNRVWRGILRADGKMTICELK